MTHVVHFTNGFFDLEKELFVPVPGNRSDGQITTGYEFVDDKPNPRVINHFMVLIEPNHNKRKKIIKTMIQTFQQNELAFMMLTGSDVYGIVGLRDLFEFSLAGYVLCYDGTDIHTIKNKKVIVGDITNPTSQTLTSQFKTDPWVYIELDCMGNEEKKKQRYESILKSLRVIVSQNYPKNYFVQYLAHEYNQI